jgi:hypothetical protein
VSVHLVPRLCLGTQGPEALPPRTCQDLICELFFGGCGWWIDSDATRRSLGTARSQAEPGNEIELNHLTPTHSN